MQMQCTLSENLHDHRLIRSRRKVHGRKVLGSAGLSPQLISPLLAVHDLISSSGALHATHTHAILSQKVLWNKILD